MRRKLLVLVGGSWHDFAAFAAWLRPWVIAAGFDLQITSDVAELMRLEEGGVELLLLYNCLDEASPVAMSDPQTLALRDWLAEGGRLLALHSASVAARGNPILGALLGGVFTGHPPLGVIEVKSVGAAHPMIGDVEPFIIEDELYRHALEPFVTVHWVAKDGQGEHPLAWTHSVGSGSVAYIALGHDERAWSHTAFYRILAQTLRWLSM